MKPSEEFMQWRDGEAKAHTTEMRPVDEHNDEHGVLYIDKRFSSFCKGADAVYAKFASLPMKFDYHRSFAAAKSFTELSDDPSEAFSQGQAEYHRYENLAVNATRDLRDSLQRDLNNSMDREEALQARVTELEIVLQRLGQCVTMSHREDIMHALQVAGEVLKKGRNGQKTTGV